VATGLAIFVALLALESTLGDYDDVADSRNSFERPLSAQQIANNVQSIFSESEQQNDGNKQWRLNWWEIIINDTIRGPNFWTGRGFGINLADADGFAGTGDPHNPRPPTRSPHNAHMTLLARAGIPGLVLWALVLLSWFGMMMKAILTARLRGHKEWVALFLFI